MKPSELKRNNYGFTLLEVLIALAIFATSVASLLVSIDNQNRALMESEIQTFSHWVALNKMAETRLEDEWPKTGVTRGTIVMRNHEWHWLQTVSETTEKDLRQVEIEVRYEESDEQFSSHFVGFIANKSKKK
ncbi:MAG: type II secretion system minor pseudopilin GspI [Gammaproteobacteria bacterium]|nr:type II secretion system minor pseudopilin GspI [Gammaproteobacteria bacterium]MDH5630951.1 type II secretion system minor pseudopilin GspI [Gammaproteobacteria bacterium]